MKRAVAILMGAPLLVSGCDHGPTSVASRSAYVASADASEGPRWVRRLDGDLDQRHLLDLLPGGPQQVVLTGLMSGEDQGCLLAFDTEGREVLRHRAARETDRGHRLLSVSSISGDAYVHEGRRFVAVGLGGLWAPYGLEVLEIDSGPEPRFVPRYRFWNPGVVGVPVLHEGLVAFRCANNSFRETGNGEWTPVAVCVLSLVDILRDRDDDLPAVGSGPRRDAGVGHGYRRYFLLNERDEYGKPTSLTVSIRDGCALARLESGLTYVLDPSNGGVQLVPDAFFGDRYARRCAADPTLPSMDEHLETLRRAVTVFTPTVR